MVKRGACQIYLLDPRCSGGREKFTCAILGLLTQFTCGKNGCFQTFCSQLWFPSTISIRKRQLRTLASCNPKIWVNKRDEKTFQVIFRLYFKVIVRQHWVRSDDDFEIESMYNLKHFLVLFIHSYLGLTRC